MPASENLTTAIGCTVGMLEESMSNLATLDRVYDNSVRLTLDSGMLFKTVDGRLEPVSNNERQALMDASGEAKAQTLAEGQFLYTPFHYVLDGTERQFDCRAYYLDEPVVYTKQFIAENEAARLEVGTMRFAIDKTDTGYRMIIVTTSGKAFRELADDQVHVQLSFVPKGEIDRAYMNGTYLGRTDDDERIFEFLIESSFDVDDEDQLQLNSFRMYDLEDRATGVPLDGVLDLQYIVSDYDIDGLEATDLDNVKGQFLLPSDTHVVIQEALKVRFGTALGDSGRARAASPVRWSTCATWTTCRRCTRPTSTSVTRRRGPSTSPATPRLGRSPTSCCTRPVTRSWTGRGTRCSSIRRVTSSVTTKATL